MQRQFGSKKTKYDSDTFFSLSLFLYIYLSMIFLTVVLSDIESRFVFWL